MSDGMRLAHSLATTEALAEVFSDESTIAAMLEVEAALARVQARLAVIPASAAEAIQKAARSSEWIALPELARDTLRAGTMAVPLVKALTDRVRATHPQSAGFVHWGATSQDVTDTALMLLLKRAKPLLAADHARIDRALARLSEEHSHTVMLGRTLLQPAPPVTFGLKAAGWLGAARRGWTRLIRALDDTLIVELGGASGTLAAWGDRGPEIGAAVAQELELRYPEAPWHAQRDRLAAFVAACGVYTGSLGKMARDLALLMQGEVGEAAEPGDAGRGGSSTMPHKRNPIACAVTLAAANRAPGLVANFLSGMIQEHERGVGGWQAEWPTVIGVVQAAGVAAASMAEAAEGLLVDPQRMHANLVATRGVIFAERVMMILGETLGRDVAYKLVEQAVRKSQAQQSGLGDVLAQIPEVTRLIPSARLRELDSAEAYLGAAETLRKRLVSGDE